VAVQRLNSTGMVEKSFSPIDFEDTKKGDAEIQNLITQG
jgi:hypothetical protein